MQVHAAEADVITKRLQREAKSVHADKHCKQEEELPGPGSASPFLFPLDDGIFSEDQLLPDGPCQSNLASTLDSLISKSSFQPKGQTDLSCNLVRAILQILLAHNWLSAVF